MKVRPSIHVCLLVLAGTHTRTFILVVFLETPALGDPYGGYSAVPPASSVCVHLLLFVAVALFMYMFMDKIIFMLHTLVTGLVQLLCYTVFESSINTLNHHKYLVSTIPVHSLEITIFIPKINIV